MKREAWSVKDEAKIAGYLKPNTDNMEKAVFITKVNQLKYIDNRYSRLYFGNEFCERLIPSILSLEQILSYVKKKKLNFSLVTPYVTNYGLEKLGVLFEFLKAEKVNCEVIINDWGVLNLINREYLEFHPVLGRLLTKQKRGPGLERLLERKTKSWLVKDPHNPKARFVVFQKKLPLGLDAYYKGSNTSSVPIIHNFLINRRIKRIELDNLSQGMILGLPKGKISASVYTPYVYITTTFFCPSAGCGQKKSLLKIKPCKRQCQRYLFKLRHKTMPKVIFLKGNTQFYKNSKLSIKELEKSGVDRIVFEPEIPV